MAGEFGRAAWAQQTPLRAGTPPLFMDGHVHITTMRLLGEGPDFWQPTARQLGLCPGAWFWYQLHRRQSRTYGARNYNYTPQNMFLRLIDPALRTAEAAQGQDGDRHHDARLCVEADRLGPHGGVHRQRIWLGTHEGDLDVLGAFYSLRLALI